MHLPYILNLAEIVMHDSIFTHWFGLASSFLSGATAIGIIAHAVNTFPMPQSKYGQWFLALVQYVVGQKDKSQQTTNTARWKTMVEQNKIESDFKERNTASKEPFL